MKKITSFLILIFLSSIQVYSQDIYMNDEGTFNQCSGQFIDHDPPSNLYNFDGSQVVTICSDDPDSDVQVDFTEFGLVTGYSLTIYDGDSTAAPSLGTFSSNTGPGLIFPSGANDTGCLTFEYTGNGDLFPGGAFGWDAEISCKEPCQEITPNVTNVSPSTSNAGVYTVEFNQSILFQGNGNFENDGTGAQYEWNFGDGDTATGQNVNHNFNNTGTFNVTLTIIGPNGCISSVETIEVEVEGASASLCDDIKPFCAGSDELVFPNTHPGNSNQANAESGPDYGCLGSEPYPAWFYLQIEEAGDLDFTIEQNANANFNGDGLDVDFVAWGPFITLDNVCNQLTSANQIPGGTGQPYDGCDFSAADIETFGIDNAQPGEYYIIVITNFQSQAGFIRMVQDNAGGSVAGSTDCSILEATLGEDQELCQGDSTILDGTTENAVNYQWYVFNETTNDYEEIPGETNTTLEITTTGIYQIETQDGDGDISTDQVQITFYENPVIAEPIGNINTCSATTEFYDLTQNNETLYGTQDQNEFEIIYFNSQTDADTNQNPINDPENFEVAPGSSQTIFFRIHNVNLTECYTTGSFDISSTEITIGALSDLTECDPENDDVTEFDLTENDAAALDGLASDEYTVSYYESQALADAGDTPIGTPTAYENTLANPQEIFVRVENNESPNCYAADNSFFIEAIPSGIANTPDLINYCYVDGLEEVDLTQNTVVVLGAQDSNDFTVSYYENSADAEAGTNVISAPDVYQPGLAEGCMTIYVRIENNADTSCYNTTSFEVCTIITEVVSVDNLEECDSDSNGSAVFDLTQNDSVALGADQGSSDYSVSYYEDEASAEAGTPAIGTPTAYENNASPQTIWVRVESNTLTSCYAVDSFTITSYENGIANPVPDLSYCDTDTNGDAVYDLTQNTPILLGAQDANDFTVSYYETIAEANVPTNAIADPANYTVGSNSQTIYVRIENAINGDCYSLTDFTLETTPVTVGVVSDKFECDGGTTGTATFDLTDSDNEALSGQSPQDYTLSYYASQTDLDNNNAIATPTAYENTSNPQEIFVRVSADDLGSCFSQTSFMIEATPSAPIADPSPLIACDTDNDGFYTLFDLESKTDEITLGNADLEVSYHLTSSDANLGVSSVSSPYANTTAYNDVIYVRVEDAVNGCVLQTELALEVYDSPMIEAPAEALSQCDDDGDGFSIFDLTQVEDEVLNGQDPTPFSVTYHQEEQEAEDGVNAITNPGGYENETNPESIWIRVTDTTTPTGCYNVVELTLEVNPLPTISQPAPLAVCDDLASGSDIDELSVFDLTTQEGFITNNNSSYSVSWYATDDPTQVDVSNAIATPSAYTNTMNEQTITAVVTDENACSIATTLTLVVNPLPSPTPSSELDPYIVCDDDNDGFAEFDLSTQDDLIANGEADVAISYYATAEDAEEGFASDELPTLYGNTTAFSQVIYARSTNTVTGCYRYVELTLEVRSLPSFAAELEDLFSCDEADGDTTAIFDLTENESTIYGDADPSLYTLAYYTSEADALSSTNPIGVPTAYSNQGVSPLTVWVRYADVESGCVRIGSFDLVVGESPAITNPSPLSACDDSAGTIDDEVGLFDLTSKTPEITGGDNSLSVSYYESQADLDNDQAIASADAYENISNEQTVQVKVSNASGCESFTSLTLVVTPNPSIAEELAALEVCDIDNDGFEEFDLESYKSVILDGEPNVSVSYHLTEDAADLGVNPIDTSAPYGTSNLAQTIWVRVTNTGPNGDDGTGCYVVRSLELIVVPSPEIAGELEDLYVCDDGNASGIAVFDLTENTANILGGQDPSQVSITYHESQADAESGDSPIAVPSQYTNLTNGQLIYVRIANGSTGCIDSFDFTDDNSFSLNVEQTPVLVQPAPLQLCAQDYDNDPFAQMEFDLTVKAGEIADEDPAPNSYVFTYYASQADLEADQPITDPTAYQNIANPQTVYVEVTNSLTENNCSNVISLTIEVLPLPSPSETDLEALRLQGCDDDNDGVAVDPFNLIQSGQLIAGGENVEISYYKTEFAAEEGDETVAEFIADPSNYINEPSFNEQNEEGLSVQVIYARVDSGINGNFCYVIVPFELQVIGAPVLNPAGDPNFGYTLCEDGSSGEAAVNFDDITENLYDPVDGDPSTIIPLLDPATDQDQNIDNYTVTYYAFEEDAEDGVDPLQNGELATNGTLYYIRVEYADTGCFNTDAIGVVEITVEERPSIVDQPIAEEFCSDEPGGDSVSIDLTQYNDQVNPGSPQGTAVVYYADQTAYENGEAIQEPSFYTTVSNPQRIIVETINTTTLCESPSVAEITISVNDRPLVDISDYDGLFICEDSNPQTPVEGGNYDPIVIDTGLNESDYSFVWTLDGSTLSETGSSLTASEPGSYQVTVSDQDGSIVCSTSSSASIEEGNPPEFNLSPLTLSFEEEHGIMVSMISGDGDYEFRLDNGPWQAANADGTLTFEGVNPGEHIVYGRDLNGCGTTLKTISFIDYPKFFTPNEDGYNDTWNIIGLQDQPRAKVYIFDRYGKLLKQLSPSGPGWDGTYNGNPVSSNDYWFRVEYMETLPDGSLQPREFKANFTLKR